MTDNIIKLAPQTIGDGFRLDVNEILDNVRSKEFTTIFVIGEDEEGDKYLFSNANAGETLVMLEIAKHEIIFGGRD